MDREEMMKKQQTAGIMRGASDPSAQRQIAYVAEMDSVTGMHMRLIGMDKAGATQEQKDAFKLIVDAASKRFLESSVKA